MSNLDFVLIHHGVKGMKWGVRRYRNEDGTLTAEGKKRYAGKSESYIKKDLAKLYTKDIQKFDKNVAYDLLTYNVTKSKKLNKLQDKYAKRSANGNDAKKEKLSNKINVIESDRKDAEKIIKQGRKDIEKVLNKLENQGYVVNAKTKEVKRHNLALTAIAGLVGAQVYNYLIYPTYQVKPKKTGGNT